MARLLGCGLQAYINQSGIDVQALNNLAIGFTLLDIEAILRVRARVRVRFMGRFRCQPRDRGPVTGSRCTTESKSKANL